MTVSRPADPATVLIDAGPAVHQRAGLARYTHQLIAHMLELAPEDLRPALFYNSHSGHTLPSAFAQTPQVALRMGQYSWRLGALAGQVLRLSLPPVMAQARRVLGQTPVLYHATEHLLPRVTVPSVLTVHDLIFEWLPTYHTRLNRTFLRLAMPRFLEAASTIIAVSNHTAHDIVARYHIDTEKIRVIYEGVDAHFQPQTAAEIARVRRQHARDEPYLLMVGTLEPRKNHATALHALKKLHKAGHTHRLIVAGGKGWLFDEVQRVVEQLELDHAVDFIGYVPGEDLPALYSGADCVLLPSLYEGFGLPVLEAMACGAPVVCSNVSSLPEVAGDAAILVDPLDDSALAHAVMSVLTDPQRAATMRRHGLAQAAQFRWEACAAATLDVYRWTLETRRGRA